MSHALEDLENIGALLTNTHVVYTSGKHGSAYVNKDAVYPHTSLTQKLTQEMASLFQLDDIEVVVAPAIGAVILGQWIAYHLSQKTGREVLSVYSEKSDTGGFVIKRGYERLIPGKNCLVVEDIINTGGSIALVLDQVRNLGGKIVGAVALCNRGGLKAQELGVPRLEALVNVSLEAWDPSECPLCKAGVPINTSVGKAKTAVR